MRARIIGGVVLAIVWVMPAWGIDPAGADGVAGRSRFPQSGGTFMGEPLELTQAPPVAPAPVPGTEATAMDPSAALPGPAPAPQEDYFSLDELKTEMKKLAWTKGDFTITPYGILWANMTWETSHSVYGDYVLYVARPKNNDNEAFDVDGKSTRLGFDLLGPRVSFFGDAQTGGKVEIDFQGNFIVENKGGLLLRHAYVEVKNDEYRLLAGQTWDVISPLYPGVLFYSVGWYGGNIGYRRAQVRGERYLALSDNVLITAQGSLNEDLLSDTLPTVAPFSVDHSGWPVLEGRLAATLGPRGQGYHPIEVGVSSHVGDTILFLAATPSDGISRRTWSLNTDIRVPITSRFGVQGELWTGENLATYFGGIGQGINLAAPYNTIRSRGGWVDAWYDWTERWHSHVGYSIDDPVDSDITSGRTYNSFIFANVSYDVTKKFMLGFEFTSWRTLWKGPYVDAPDQHFDFVAKYGF